MRGRRASYAETMLGDRWGQKTLTVSLIRMVENTACIRKEKWKHQIGIGCGRSVENKEDNRTGQEKQGGSVAVVRTFERC